MGHSAFSGTSHGNVKLVILDDVLVFLIKTKIYVQCLPGIPLPDTPHEKRKHLSSQRLGQSCSDLHKLLQTRKQSSVHQQVDSMNELWRVHSVVYHAETRTKRAHQASKYTNSTMSLSTVMATERGS